MCLSAHDSAFREVVSIIELSFLILAGAGPLNHNWFSLGSQKRVGPASMYAVPVVLMHDHCEDG